MAEVLRAGRGVASFADLRAAGCTRAAVRWAVGSGVLHRLAAGHVASTAVWDVADDRGRHLLELRAALARAPGTVAAAGSAAVVWGLPLPGPPPDRPVLVRPRTTARPQHGARTRTTVLRRAWLRSDEHRRGPGGLPVTTPGRTFVDLARHSSFPWALAAVDAVRRFHRADAAELVELVRRQTGSPGAGRALRAASASTRDAESPLESVARAVQIELGLPVPALQVWIGEREPEFRVDMLVERFATVVEADGRLKYDGPTARGGQVWADKRRLDRLLDLGYDCHRFVMDDVARPEAWGRSLVQVFERSQRRRGRPAPRLDLPWLT